MRLKGSEEANEALDDRFEHVSDLFDTVAAELRDATTQLQKV